MKNKKRPKYIEKQLNEINDILRDRRLKYNDKYNDNLFNWFTQHLLTHGWYRGFNMYYDKTCIIDGQQSIIRVLAGPEYEKYDYYIQIW